MSACFLEMKNRLDFLFSILISSESMRNLKLFALLLIKSAHPRGVRRWRSYIWLTARIAIEIPLLDIVNVDLISVNINILRS